MLRSIPTLHLAVILYSALFAAAAHAAESAAVTDAAKRLLEKGWENTAAARAIVDECDPDSPALKVDSIVRAAHWLALMNQGRYEQALESVQRFVKDQPSHLLGIRAEVWICTVKQNYPQALLAAEKLAVAANPNPPSTDQAVARTQEQAIAFLGRFIGFLEGPVEKAANQNARKASETQIVARLDEPRKKLFADAKSTVLQQFQNLVATTEGATEGAKQAAENARQQALEKLSKDKEAISQKAGKVEEDKKQLQEQRQKALNQLDRQDAPLIARLTMLQTRVNSLISQQNQQQAEALRFDKAGSKEGNAQLQREAQRAREQAANTKREIEHLNGLIQTTQAERARVQQQKMQIQGGAALQGQKLDGETQRLENEQRKNENKQKRAERAKSTTPGNAIAHANEARAFRTYDSFPLNELRSRLLERLK